jgi:hypothetical protein
MLEMSETTWLVRCTIIQVFSGVLSLLSESSCQDTCISVSQCHIFGKFCLYVDKKSFSSLCHYPSQPVSWFPLSMWDVFPHTCVNTWWVRCPRTSSMNHKGPADHVYFLIQPSPEWIFPTTLHTAYQITLGLPVPGLTFSTHCWAAWDCDVTSTCRKVLSATKIACGLLCLSAKYK